MRRLRAIRMHRFLTQKGLAAQLGVPFFTVQRWESGAAFPQARHLEKLCTVLGVSPDELVEPDEWPQPRRAKTRVAA